MSNNPTETDKKINSSIPSPHLDGSSGGRWTMVALAAVVVIVLAGAAAYVVPKLNTSKAPVTNRVVKIGLMAPLTGDLANYGQVFQHGVELAQHDFNQEGLTFQIYVRDTVCDPAKAAAATTELAQVGVVAIIGDTCSSSTLAALNVANAKKVLIISPSASSAKLSIADDFFFRTYPIDSRQGLFATQLMHDKGIKSLAILYGNEVYGIGLNTVAQDNFKKLGGTIVSDSSFENTDTNFKARLQTIQAAQPDALYIASKSVAVSASIVVEAKQLGLTMPIYGSDALKDASFLTAVGAAGSGMTIMAPTPGNQTFLDEYKATYGAAPANATGAQAYDAFMALARVIKDGAASGEQIRQSLPKVNFQGLSGEIKFDKYGDLAGGSYNVYVIKDGQFSLTSQ
jgi:branched-chain amino acid transport system substrate-binding protein